MFTMLILNTYELSINDALWGETKISDVLRIDFDASNLPIQNAGYILCLMIV